MQYKTYRPIKDLNTFVKCFWTLEGPKENADVRQTIVPDACIEMIFHYGDLYIQHLENGKSIVQPRCFVIGQLTRPLEIEPSGETGIFSVRFHPMGFLPFATVPIKELENTAVSLEKLFGKEGRELEEKILKTNSTRERIEYIESYLLQRLINRENVDRIVVSTVETILTANGQFSINEISRQAKISRRQLERKFSSAIGLSPKQLSKTIRLQATLKMLLNNNFTSLTSLAYENEYYDQAHFIRDFKKFTGHTPKGFYGNNLKLSSLFTGTD
ncbi:MAG: helix-turn-helix domain-containing protein [Bacteroidetes bacterium]|nr:MAG: helix-turn-helix domain-containing protein [Bacteroidota bacterium]